MKFSLRDKLLAVLVVLAIIFTYQITLRSGEVPKNGWVIIGNHSFVVDIADTEKLREKGLSFRKTLNKDSGMIFVFEKPETHHFWMKDMDFPIDIIWIDEDLKIGNIEKNIDPKTYPNSYSPESPSQYVLEINGGRSDELGIKEGEPVIINLGN